MAPRGFSLLPIRASEASLYFVANHSAFIYRENSCSIAFNWCVNNRRLCMNVWFVVEYFVCTGNVNWCVADWVFDIYCERVEVRTFKERICVDTFVDVQNVQTFVQLDIYIIRYEMILNWNKSKRWIRIVILHQMIV